MITLSITTPEGKMRKYEVRGSEIQIGRDPTNHVRINDDRTSRRHAKFVKQGERYYIIDLNSTNGTFVNGKKIERALLKSGDRIQIGRSLIDIQLVPSDPMIPVADEKEETSETTVHLVEAKEDDSSAIISLEPNQQPENILGLIRQRPAKVMEERQRLMALCSITASIGYATNAKDIANRIIREIVNVIDADRAIVFQIAAHSDDWQAIAVWPAHLDDPEIRLSRTVREEVQKKQDGVICVDTMSDDVFSQSESILIQGTRSLMCAPIKAGDAIMGALYVDTRRFTSSYNVEDLQLLCAVANEIGLALSRIQLMQEKQQALRRAALGEAVAGLSHYIKNLLDGLAGGIVQVEHGIEQESLEDVSKGLSFLRDYQARISSLVMDMLNISRESGPAFVEVDLRSVIDDIVMATRSRCEEHNISMETEIAENLPTIQADKSGIHRALLNIVNNAIDALKDTGGRIVIRGRLGPSDRRVTLEVEDNGPGIPSAYKSQIFDMFFTTKGAQGTGLGLAVTSRIVKEHNGHIQVFSKEGQGTRFCIVLPRNQTDLPIFSPARLGTPAST